MPPLTVMSSPNTPALPTAVCRTDEDEQAISLMMACDIHLVHVRPQMLAFSYAIIAWHGEKYGTMMENDNAVRPHGWLEADGM